MIRARVGLFSAVAMLCVLWSAQALLGHVVRLNNQPVLQVIRKGEVAPDRHDVAEAISEYQWAMKFAPCNAALHADLALFVAHEADAAMATADEKNGDAAIDAMQQTLLSRLACTAGASARAFSAYRMSALAAPGESWLAKKRLEFALTFLPLLTEKELAVARADLAVLERAHPNNMIAIQTAAKVENKQALYALFGATAPADAP